MNILVATINIQSRDQRTEPVGHTAINGIIQFLERLSNKKTFETIERLQAKLQQFFLITDSVFTLNSCKQKVFEFLRERSTQRNRCRTKIIEILPQLSADSHAKLYPVIVQEVRSLCEGELLAAESLKN